MKKSPLTFCTMFRLIILSLTLAVPSLAVAKSDPVRIYVLVGQSNMQGKGNIEGDGSNSLRSIVKSDAKKEFQFLVNEDGSWRERSDVWIHLDGGPGNIKYSDLKPGYGSHGGLIGPELGFGHVIGDASDAQVLLIKACWGGKSLGHNFLPPSIGQVSQSQPGQRSRILLP